MKEADKKLTLREGKRTAFWGLILEYLNDTIKMLKIQLDDEDIRSLPAEAYKFKRETIEYRIRHLQALKELPEDMIGNMSSPKKEEGLGEYDPYKQASDFENLN